MLPIIAIADVDKNVAVDGTVVVFEDDIDLFAKVHTSFAFEVVEPLKRLIIDVVDPKRRRAWRRWL